MLQIRVIKLYLLILSVLKPIERSVSMQTESARWSKDVENLNATVATSNDVVDSSDSRNTHAEVDQVINIVLYQRMSIFHSESFRNSEPINTDEDYQTTQKDQHKFIIFERMKRKVTSTNDKSICPDSLIQEVVDYVRPIILIILFIAGVLTNGIILLIYARHEEMRTPKNTLFINLAVSDLIFLLIFVGVYGIGQIFGIQPIRCLDEVPCRIYVFLCGVAATINPYSIAVICVQRYFGVAKFSNPKLEIVRRSFTRPKVLLSLIWSLSVILALPEATRRYEYINGVFICGDPYVDADSIFILITFAIIPVIIICVFWIITARLLTRESEAFRRARLRGARVLLALTIVFLLTYMPAILCNIISNNTEPNTSTELFCYSTKILLPINSAINPVALFVVSGRFRSYLRHYLLCRCCKEVDHSGNMETESTYETRL